MVSLTQWTQVWASSRSWWWTGKPGTLQSMGLQIQTWLSNWTELRSRRKNVTSITSISLIHSVKLTIIKYLPHAIFPGGSNGKASAYNAGDPGSSLGWEDPLEKKMATHSSTLAWKIPWTEESGRLESMGSQRVGHDWATLLHHMPWTLFQTRVFEICVLVSDLDLKQLLVRFKYYLVTKENTEEFWE